MALLKFLAVFGVLAVSLTNVLFASAETHIIHRRTFPHVIDCREELGITMHGNVKEGDSDIYDNQDPCVMACVFKKNNKQIDDQGLFHVSNAKEFVTKFISDETDKKMAIEVTDNCKSINEQQVTDGEKGCERAKLLLECYRPIIEMFNRDRT